ncbi:MAG: hypothetical protein LBC68_06775 [Prevotellaceae bacterium]|jgi:hypothetical protein|nr:hypothetical protein [Prevotellaceae bacterium]
MEIKNNTVWIVKGHDSFAVFSSKEYSEEYRLSLIELWHKSIIKDAIPPMLKNRDEVWDHAKEYEEVIEVENDHYVRVNRWVSGPKETKEWMEYDLMSNKEWEKYYNKYISEFVIEDWLIMK